MAKSMSQKKSKCTGLMVAAIDFGTTYSGYAFSLLTDHEKDPLKVQANVWNASSRSLQSYKTPTTVLLGPDKKFLKFGFEAEEMYSQLAEDEDEDHTKYFYLRRFKMLLFGSGEMKRNMTIPDEQGRPVNALSVFSMSIKYLKEHLEAMARKRGIEVQESDCQWVLTVPAIWSDGAKQFMREAAEMAGIKKDYLIIALEPEAASLCCMHLPISTVEDGKSVKRTGFDKGTKYMVVDVGGGTVDITVHEVLGERKLKELNWASGGAWGGTRVDQAFTDILIKIMGKTIYKKFIIDHTEDYIDLFREFEVKKRNAKVDDSKKTEQIIVPVNLVDLYEGIEKQHIQVKIDKIPELKGKLTLKGGKLKIDMSIFRGFFNESIKNTISHVKRLMGEKASADTKYIVLVGGFSESVLFQEEIKNNFPKKKLIVPEEAGLAVLKGAVMFGHNPLTIVSRIARCSYGIRVFRNFDATLHPREKMITVNSKKKCKDVFGIHVKKGDTLIVGQPQSEQRYTSLESDQTSLIFDIYTSTEREPKFITDPGCCFIGQLEVDVNGLPGQNNGVLVKMIFGGTELVVEARDEKTNEVSKAQFNFLGE